MSGLTEFIGGYQLLPSLPTSVGSSPGVFCLKALGIDETKNVESTTNPIKWTCDPKHRLQTSGTGL